MAFLDDLKGRINTAARTVKSKTRDGVEITKIAGEIRSVDAAISNLYADLGRLYYHSEGADAEGLNAICANLRSMLARRSELEDMRAQIKNQRKCPDCGCSVPAGARFCGVCGARVPDEEPEADVPAAEPLRFCECCGAMLGADGICPVCGAGSEPGANE